MLILPDPSRIVPPLVLGLFQGRLASSEEADEMYRILDRSAARAGVENPRLFIAAGAAANAFAFGDGTRCAFYGVTQGLLEVLNPDEFEALMIFLTSRLSPRFFWTDTLAVLWTRLICILFEKIGRFILFSLGFRTAGGIKRFTNGVSQAVFFSIRLVLQRQSAVEYEQMLCRLENPLILLAALKKMEASSRKNALRRFPPWLLPLWLLVPAGADDPGFRLGQGARLEDFMGGLEEAARIRGY